MKTRIITAAVLLCLFIPVLIFSDTFVYPAACAILSAVGVFELLRCLSLSRDLPLLIPALLLGAALPFFAFWRPDTSAYLLLTAGCFFLFFLYLMGLSVFRGGRFTYAEVSRAFAGCFYVTAAFVSLVLLRYITHGAYWFLLPYLGAWITDTFAYFTGRLFGRHKLAPDVSPKKTVEGSVGGVVFCVAAFLLYGLILGKENLTPNYPVLALCALVVSVVSQIGDLSLSVIKRENGIKDYGRIFPGHGGVLDRFDSVIATAPLFLFLYLINSGTHLFH